MYAIRDCAFAVHANLAVLDVAGVEQTDQERPTDVEEFGRLLGGELGMGGHDRDPLSGSHVREHSGEELDRAPRHDKRLLGVVGDDEPNDAVGVRGEVVLDARQGLDGRADVGLVGLDAGESQRTHGVYSLKTPIIRSKRNSFSALDRGSSSSPPHSAAVTRCPGRDARASAAARRVRRPRWVCRDGW